MTIEAFNLFEIKGIFPTSMNSLIRCSLTIAGNMQKTFFRRLNGIALAENILDPRLLMLMKIAALFHDTGFVDIYVGHEKRSCEIMIDALKDYEVGPSEIDLMTKMIMATKMPQSPVTLHEQVLCDADLDYLVGMTFGDQQNTQKRIACFWIHQGTRKSGRNCRLTFSVNTNISPPVR